MTAYSAAFVIVGCLAVFLAVLILVGNALNPRTRTISNRFAGLVGIAGCVLFALAVLL